MIVEVRTYKLKPGSREKFLTIFETRSIPAHHEIGMKIVGPLLDIETADAFVFLRGFPSLEDRDRMKTAFYEGELWKGELEAILMPMIENYVVTLCEVPPGFVFDDIRAGV